MAPEDTDSLDTQQFPSPDGNPPPVRPQGETLREGERLIAALRATVAQVEQSAGVPPDDPALVALKSIVLGRIADLELARASAASAPSVPDSASDPAELPAPAAIPQVGACMIPTPRQRVRLQDQDGKFLVVWVDRDRELCDLVPITAQEGLVENVPFVSLRSEDPTPPSDGTASPSSA